MRMKRNGCGVCWVRRGVAVLLATAASLAVAVPGAWGVGVASARGRGVAVAAVPPPPAGADQSSDKDMLPKSTEAPTVTGVRVTVNGAERAVRQTD